MTSPAFETHTQTSGVVTFTDALVAVPSGLSVHLSETFGPMMMLVHVELAGKPVDGDGGGKTGVVVVGSVVDVVVDVPDDVVGGEGDVVGVVPGTVEPGSVEPAPPGDVVAVPPGSSSQGPKFLGDHWCYRSRGLRLSPTSHRPDRSSGWDRPHLRSNPEEIHPTNRILRLCPWESQGVHPVACPTGCRTR